MTPNFPCAATKPLHIPHDLESSHDAIVLGSGRFGGLMVWCVSLCWTGSSSIIPSHEQFQAVRGAAPYPLGRRMVVEGQGRLMENGG